MPKKSFKDNPALQFITVQEPEVEPMQPVSPPAGYKVNPMYIEVRSKRINVLMQPSLHERAKAVANQRGVSLNELIHAAVEEYVEREETK